MESREYSIEGLETSDGKMGNTLLTALAGAMTGNEGAIRRDAGARKKELCTNETRWKTKGGELISGG